MVNSMTVDGSLSLYEAVQLFYLALSAQDRFLELWISATFAVIIALALLLRV